MRYALAIVATLFAGCAATPYGPQFTPAGPPPPGQSLLYVFRASVPTFSSPLVSLNGQPLFKLGLEGYTRAYLSPGRYVVTTESDYAPPFEFTAQAGTTSGLYLHEIRATGPTTLSGFIIGPKLAAPVFGSESQPRHPYEWGYFENALLPFVYNDLKTRKYLEPVQSAFTPLP